MAIDYIINWFPCNSDSARETVSNSAIGASNLWNDWRNIASLGAGPCRFREIDLRHNIKRFIHNFPDIQIRDDSFLFSFGECVRAINSWEIIDPCKRCTLLDSQQKETFTLRIQFMGSMTQCWAWNENFFRSRGSFACEIFTSSMLVRIFSTSHFVFLDFLRCTIFYETWNRLPLVSGNFSCENHKSHAQNWRCFHVTHRWMFEWFLGGNVERSDIIFGLAARCCLRLHNCYELFRGKCFHMVL